MPRFPERMRGKPLLNDMGGEQFIKMEDGTKKKIHVVWFRGGGGKKDSEENTICAYREYNGGVLLKEEKFMNIEELRERLVYPVDADVDRRMKIQKKGGE